jgi:DNA (cytosine-5)-methyltransferase 1
MPSPNDIKEARLRAGLTQSEAGRLVGGSRRTWQNWEAGVSRIPAAKWELFQIKVAGQK